MKAFVEKVVNKIIKERKNLLNELASETYAQKLRKSGSNKQS
jgi:hypothetical protein